MTATVSYFFEGVDVNTGVVNVPMTRMIIVYGKPHDVAEALTSLEDEGYLDFKLDTDFYFDFDAIEGASLVLQPEHRDSDDPNRIVGMAVLEDIAFEEVHDDVLANLVFSEELIRTPIADDLTIVLLTASGDHITLGNFEEHEFGVGFDGDGIVPEPSTLLLLILGLLGLIGIRRRRRNMKHIKRFLVLMTVGGLFIIASIQPVAAQICDSVTEIPKSECEALVAIYNSTDGENWYVDSHRNLWLQTVEPCDWVGVTCENGHVTGINLGEFDLQGELPPEIANLTYLESLELYYNYNIRSLPAEIGELTELRYLDMSETNLRDSLPSEIGNLINLRGLFLIC